MTSDTLTTMDELIEEMADHFEKMESEYHDGDWCEIVYEDDDVVVIADHKGHELNEWGNDFGDYREVSEYMHTRAKKLCDYNWSTSYPVVFEKR